MQIFDELKTRGVQEIGFISMDVTGLDEGAKAIFPEVVVQRCIVHLIHNSLKYVPTKDYKDFTTHLPSENVVLPTLSNFLTIRGGAQNYVHDQRH